MMTKPPFLYHASTNTNIVVFEPRVARVRDPAEGPRVFATPDKRVAAMFMTPIESSKVEISKFGDEAVMIISGTREDFIAHDKGGAIYTLPSDTFTTDPHRGMKETEWVSAVPVKPIAKEIYPSSLQAMLDLGVRVIFVDEASFKTIRESEDGGWKLIQALNAYGENL
jgi:hypothetical protein